MNTLRIIITFGMLFFVYQEAGFWTTMMFVLLISMEELVLFETTKHRKYLQLIGQQLAAQQRGKDENIFG